MKINRVKHLRLNYAIEKWSNQLKLSVPFALLRFKFIDIKIILFAMFCNHKRYKGDEYQVQEFFFRSFRQ